MEFRVTALVLSHDRPEYLRVTLEALAAQTRQPDRVLIVDSSDSENAVAIIEESGYETLRLRKLEDFNQAFNACFDRELAASSGIEELLWFLHDDSAPFPDALERLVASFERSPSVAMLGPKQLDWHRPHVIAQQGLTLTPLGRPWPRVSDQLDQSQHDRDSDVLAIGTAGMLIKFEVFQQLEGFSTELVPWAADFDLSLRARRAGHRIIVVPEARVAHARLGLRGLAQNRWRGGNTDVARRRAEIELRFVQASAATSILYLVFLPLVTILRALWRLAARRPGLFYAEIAAMLATFAKLPKLFEARSRVTRTTKLSLGRLRDLRASWRELRVAARERRDLQQPPEAQLSATPASGFFESGSVWIIPALSALAFPFWVFGQAAFGGGFLPLVSDWPSLAAAAGAEIRFGSLAEPAPADPFHWLLALLSAPTFLNPNLALVLLQAAALPLGFVSARLALLQVSQKTWIRNLGALCFALWPSNLEALAQGRLPGVLAHILLPLALFLLSRAAGLGGRPSARASAAAALVMAGLSAASPVLGALLLFVWLALLLWRPSSAPRLLWLPIPTLAIWAPLAAWLLSKGYPLWLLLGEPGLPTASETPSLWQFALGGISWSSPWWLALTLLPPLLAALAATFIGATSRVVPYFALAALALAAATALPVLSFPAASLDLEHQALAPSLGGPSTLFAISALSLTAAFLEAVDRALWRKLVAVALLVLTVSPLAALAFTREVSYRASSAQTVPAVVAAEYQAGLRANILQISETPDARYVISVSGNRGLGLEHQSLAARVMRAAQAGEVPSNVQVSDAAAELLFGSGRSATELAERDHIAYVLIQSARDDLLAEFDANPALEAIGATDFGRLYRLRAFDPEQNALSPSAAQDLGLLSEPPLWGLGLSTEKAVTLLIIGLYLIALLPLPGARK